MNIFFTILTNSFTKLKNDINRAKEFEVINYVFEKLKELLERIKAKRSNSLSQDKYTDTDHLEKFYLMLNKLEKVKNNFLSKNCKFFINLYFIIF